MLIFQGLESYGLLVLRVFLGIIFLYHGVPKLTSPSAMAKGMGWPTSSLFILGFFESISGLALILGFYTEIAALVVGVVMLGSLYHKIFKWKISFFAMDKTGWEFDFILLGVALTVLLLGAGAFSLDALLGIWP